MDERVKSIFTERELKQEIETAKYMIDQDLFDLEYDESIDEKYKSLKKDDFITFVSDTRFFCKRVKDNKVVAISKATSSEHLNEIKVLVPLEVTSDILGKIIEGDKKLNYGFSDILITAAYFFYVLALVFGVIAFALAAEEGGFYFVPVFVSSTFIVFLGLVLHGMSHILTNVVNINKKIK